MLRERFPPKKNTFGFIFIFSLFLVQVICLHWSAAPLRGKQKPKQTTHKTAEPLEHHETIK